MNTSNITNYKPKDFSELLGVSVKTIQRWDREGVLKANRTSTDRRYYIYDQYLQFIRKNRTIIDIYRKSPSHVKGFLVHPIGIEPIP